MEALGIELTASVDKALATIKGGLDQVGGYVDKLNKKEIDWDEVLAGALDPATIVGEIAALFASATLSTAEFQSSLQNASADAASSFGDNMGAAGQAALNLSATTGISAGSAAQTLGVLSAQWQDTSMQTAIATDSADLAAAGLGNASDIASQFSQVLKEFGVSDAPTAQLAMQELYTAARNSGMGWGEFMNTIISNAPALASNKITIQDSANALAALATQSGMTASTAVSAFSSFASAISPGNIQAKALLEAISPGLATALKDGNITAALTALEEGFSKGGTAAALIGQQAGVSSNDIAALGNAGKTNLGYLATEADSLAEKEKKLGTNLDAPVTSVEQLGKAWNELYSEFLKDAGPIGNFLINVLTFGLNQAKNALDGVTAGMATLDDKVTGGQFQALLNLPSGISNAVQNIDANKTAMEGMASTLLGKSGISGSLGSHSASDFISQYEKSGGKLSDLVTALSGAAGSTSSVGNISNTLNLGNINIASNASPNQIASQLVTMLVNKFYNH